MSCIAPGCKTGYGKSKLPPGVTKHVFPKNPVRYEAWLKAIPRDNWKPAPTAVICSLHFESTDFKPENDNLNKKGETETKRRRLKEDAVPSKFSVNDYERCCINGCNNISNTFAFPRLKKKDWTNVMREYLKDESWEPQYWTRLCSDHFRQVDIIKTTNRPDRLNPRANPVLDPIKYPPVKKDVQAPRKPALKEPLLDNKSVFVRHDSSLGVTFILDRSKVDQTSFKLESQESAEKIPEDLPPKFHDQHRLYLLQKKFEMLQQNSTSQKTLETDNGELELRHLKPESINSSTKFPNTILMRAKGNPNVFVQIDAQLWTPTSGKMPNLPFQSKQPKDENQKLAERKLGTMKDRRIRKLTNKVERLLKKNSELRNKLNDLAKTLSTIFEQDQLNFLSCTGEVKKPKLWSEKTFAKAFDLRLNCGNQAYNYLLEKGYPLPSFKAMRRYIVSIEEKLKQEEAGHHEEVIHEVIFSQVGDEGQHDMVPQSVVIESSQNMDNSSTITIEEQTILKSHGNEMQPGVYEVQSSVPLVVTSDSMGVTYTNPQHSILTGNEIQFQSSVQQMSHNQDQQIYILQSTDPQVSVFHHQENFRLHSGSIIRDDTIVESSSNLQQRFMEHQNTQQKKRKGAQEREQQEGPIWYLKLSPAVRQMILFPKSNEGSSSIPTTTTTTRRYDSEDDPDSDSDFEMPEVETKENLLNTFSIHVVDENRVEVMKMDL